jgi:hypothetical protein
MKGILFKTGGDYLLKDIDGKIIAITNGVTEGKKLSKQNCDEIFGVVDVEKLAEYEYPTINLGVNITTDIHVICQEPFINGFNKAMELNKDRMFTLEEMFNVIDNISFVKTNSEELNSKDYQPYITDEDGQLWTFNKQYLIEYIQSFKQPTEIKVEVEMKKVVDETKVIGSVKNIKGSGDIITTYKSEPKLDPDGCLILKVV